MGSNATDLIPPVRLGRLLRQHREERGWSRAELAAMHAVDPADLDALEAGLRLLDDDALSIVARVYGVEHGQIVPHRSELVIDLHEGTISAAGRTVDTDPSAPAELVLTRYLALVHALRGIDVGAPFSLRGLDVDVLAQALSVSATRVEDDLGRLLAEPNASVRSTTRRLRRSVVVPVAGLLVGVTAIGGLVLVRSDGGTTAEADPADPTTGLSLPLVEIGQPATLERSSAGPTPPGVEIGDPATIERPVGGNSSSN